MNRLTKYDGAKAVPRLRRDQSWPEDKDNWIRVAATKLAAYEDCGMYPAEVLQMKEDYQELECMSAEEMGEMLAGM